MTKKVFFGFVILWLVLFARLAEARYDYELGSYWSRDSACRDGADADDWIERGRASVTDSPVYSEGIRLTALAVEEGEEFEPGLASAIYRFSVPRWTNYVKIRVRYKDVSRDDKVAGRLWVKTTDKDVKRELNSEEEVPFYGDTFVLRSDRTSETIYVPCARHVENGELEMHIVAEGRDCLDIKYIGVEYLQRKPTGIAVIHRVYDDYWHIWPPFWYVYHYYYWGPYYWPRAYLVFECWDWPHDYYWTTWRPWFRLYVRAHRCYPWWGPRRYTAIYRCAPHVSPVKKRALLRRRLKERHIGVVEISRSRSMVSETVRAPSEVRAVRTQQATPEKHIRGSQRIKGEVGREPVHRRLQEQPVRVEKRQQKVSAKHYAVVQRRQDAQHSIRTNPGSASSSYIAGKQISSESQERPQTPMAPQISRPKPVVREGSRIRTDRAQEARSKELIKGQPEIRRQSRSQSHPEIRRSGSHSAKSTFSIRTRSPALSRARR